MQSIAALISLHSSRCIHQRRPDRHLCIGVRPPATLSPPKDSSANACIARIPSREMMEGWLAKVGLKQIIRRSTGGSHLIHSGGAKVSSISFRCLGSDTPIGRCAGYRFDCQFDDDSGIETAFFVFDADKETYGDLPEPAFAEDGQRTGEAALHSDTILSSVGESGRGSYRRDLHKMRDPRCENVPGSGESPSPAINVEVWFWRTLETPMEPVRSPV